MTTRDDEITGGRQVVPERPFEFGEPNNFVITWANQTFGVMNGEPFSTGQFRWSPRDTKLRWLDAEILFLKTILERIVRYREVTAAQQPNPPEEEAAVVAPD